MAEKVKRYHSRHQVTIGIWRVRIRHENGETNSLVRINKDKVFLWTVLGWHELCEWTMWTPLIKLLREVTR